MSSILWDVNPEQSSDVRGNGITCLSGRLLRGYQQLEEDCLGQVCSLFAPCTFGIFALQRFMLQVTFTLVLSSLRFTLKAAEGTVYTVNSFYSDFDNLKTH